MAPNRGINADAMSIEDLGSNQIRCAILGCGMMGQEHISYISGYEQCRIDYLCDPHDPSLEQSLRIMKDFGTRDGIYDASLPIILRKEQDLLEYAQEIDLLVIATPNYLHTESLLMWGYCDLTILVEKPVAVSREQHDMLQDLMKKPDFIARVWVAMEYRYIPAIAKLLSLLPTIGELKMVTIRENRYPFLHKIGAWNRDPAKTGDTLVEKCCHFFDLFRLITGQEVSKKGVRALAQRGLNYQHEMNLEQYERPIIDSAYVVMPFKERQVSGESTHDDKKEANKGHAVMGSLELCMYAEGSRHQEEIIVTGTKGRLEAYLPENKMFFFQRPDSKQWQDRSIPPPANSIKQEIFDCSDVKDVHGIDQDMPTHAGYHYSSTAVEWYHLISAMNKFKDTGRWEPHVSLDDGLKAVEIGLQATRAIVNERNDDYLTRTLSSPLS